MKKNIDSTYVCEECGNTTPLPSEECSACMGKMVPLEDSEIEKLPDENEQPNGDESLESLQSQEEKEAEEDYRNTFQDSDNPE